MCSSTSAAITRLKEPSPNGMAGAAPPPARAPARRRPGHGHAADLAQLTVVGIEGDHRRAAPVGLVRVPPATATEVQQTVVRPDGEAAEINGQQGSAPFTRLPLRSGACRGMP